MSSWSLDWLKQRSGWEADLAKKGRQRKLGAHLVHLFRQAISTNLLLPGDRLPSARDLMQELRISRNTAAYVYEQLCAEGYVFSRVGSGTFVAAVTPAMVHKALVLSSDGLSDVVSIAPNPIQFSDRAQEILKTAGAGNKQWGAFMPGVPDVAAFPRAAYARIINHLWRHAQPEMLTYGTNGGAQQLKKALANYLRVGRGVQCIPEQILITEGLHQAIDLIIRSLVNPGDSVWIEEPCYWGIKNLIKINPGINIEHQCVDFNGMVLDSTKPKPKLIFCTPSHQYPLGYLMSLERRLNFLKYAKSNQCLIVEDDYDSEFRFGGRQMPSMQGLEKDSPVIYIGTFSKTLCPSLRVGYMVMPLDLIEPMKKMQSEIFRQGHLVTHMALGEFINHGHYTKHVRKMRVIYEKRREFLRDLITKYLGDNYLSPIDSNAGLHLILYLPKHVDDVAICEKLQEAGILSKALSKYYSLDNKSKGLLLGYASICEIDIQKYFFDMLFILNREGCLSESTRLN
jgi:GntR family transcriptional regulator/MocR family aminotransferase